MKYTNKLLLICALLFAAQSALAGSIADTYNPGDTLTATKLNNVKTAVNDNNTKVTNNTGAINNNATKISTNVTAISNLGGRVTALEAKRPGPIAFGTIRSAVLYADSGNVAISWDATLVRYTISITGESYFINNYVTMVTPLGGTGTSCSTDSLSGNLLVTCFDNAGVKIQSSLGFVVFKP